jgi:hypothetical protein
MHPNWNHNAQGIACRADWRGAKVYVFHKSSFGRTKIIAHSLTDALFALEQLEAASDEAWERENEGVESVQELSL